MFKGFKFGRNLLSFFIVFGGLIVLCLIALFIYMPVSAASYRNSTTLTPYKTYTEKENNVPSSIDVEGIEYIKYDDFKDFNIKFTLVTYQSKRLDIKLKFEENDKTKELNINKEKNGTRSAAICITSPYANKLDYSSNRNSIKFGTEYSFSLSSLSYPITVSHFPVFKTIIKPNLYLYVKYQYTTENARLIIKKYSIEFTPEQYYDASKKQYSNTTNNNFYWHQN